jgi:hypothetical protein
MEAGSNLSLLNKVMPVDAETDLQLNYRLFFSGRGAMAHPIYYRDRGRQAHAHHAASNARREEKKKSFDSSLRDAAGQSPAPATIYPPPVPCVITSDLQDNCPPEHYHVIKNKL